MTNPDVDTELLFADDEYVAFRDYRPAGEHHYLVIPRDHIKSVGVLNADNVPMVRRMEEIARQVYPQDCRNLPKA